MSKAVYFGAVIFGLIFIATAFILPNLDTGNWFEPKFTVSGTVRLEYNIIANQPDIYLESVRVEKQWLPFALTTPTFTIGGIQGERTIISIDGKWIDAGRWSVGGIGAPVSEYNKPFTIGGISAGNKVLKVDLYQQGSILKSQSITVQVS